MQWLGTNDVSAYLSVPAAIRFQKEHNWPEIRKACHRMLAGGLQRIRVLTGLPSIYPEEQAHDLQMGTAELPPATDLAQLKSHLYEEYRVEVPLLEWNGRKIIRISVQGYNTQQDIDVLLAALEHLLQLQWNAQPTGTDIDPW